jgi:hypothetical protein
LRLSLSPESLPKSYNAKRIQAFIDRWKVAHGNERRDKDSFFIALCDALGVEKPGPSDPDYCFEKSVATHGAASRGRKKPDDEAHVDAQFTTKFIDFYKKGHFVIEAKQGGERGQSQGSAVRGTYEWSRVMEAAFIQGLNYANHLPEGRPPFLLTCDIGYCFEVWDAFSGNYGGYGARRRIMLEELAKPEIFKLFHDLFTQPEAQDPTKVSAKITREVAGKLAVLAKSLEERHSPEKVAKFLIRCLFTMFVEDIGMLPDNLFSRAVSEIWQPNPKEFPSGVEALWEAMDKGERFGFVSKLLRFNGGLFAKAKALPLTAEQLELLADAAKMDWANVEPSIFGTLLERALLPEERHKLGAHYTPRAYIERLVRVVVEEPLRDEWVAVQAEVEQDMRDLEAKKKGGSDGPARRQVQDRAIERIQAFHQRLAKVKVLDPACGSGNFLYVTLDLLKRLELEVLQRLQDLGFRQMKLEMEAVTVNPAQFYGIEVKPWAREIAEMVIWIGYLQWHHRINGEKPPLEPVLKDLKNIEGRDALITWEGTESDVDPKTGRVQTRWDGKTFKPHPVTGALVPDEMALVEGVRYLNAKPAKWPDVDFIVGNPPFIGAKRIRILLGDGYADAVRAAYRAAVPESADYVMFWWHKAAEYARLGRVIRFGFITTNSLSQPFNRRVIEYHQGAKPLIKLLWAISDHPWVDSTDGAAVRIAMTCAGAKEPEAQSRLLSVESEDRSGEDALIIKLSETVVDELHANLKAGSKLTDASLLKANGQLSNTGIKLHGAGFIITREEAALWGYDPNDDRPFALARVIKPYVNGRDLTAISRRALVIDFDDRELEDAARFPQAFQRVLDRVKPERDQNNEAYRRTFWWRFGRKNTELRAALKGLSRYIATTTTAKHRMFVFLDALVMPDDAITAIAIDDAYPLGVLSSRVHLTWALAAGGTLEDRPRYLKTACFDPFPFPDPAPELAQRIRELGDRLDAFRKERQAAHPDLTLTGMYNLLEKLRSGEPFTAKEKALHDKALTSILLQIHDDLDAAVLEAYGWPRDISDEEILERLVELNAQRAEEEANGHIRWLRPDFQNPAVQAEQPALPELTQVVPQAKPAAKTKAKPKAAAVAEPLPKTAEKQAWPAEIPEQFTAIRNLLRGDGRAWTPEEIQSRFKSSRKETIRQRLEALEALGVVVREGDESWRA